MDRRVGIHTVRTLAGAAMLLAASEMLVSSPSEVSAQTGSKTEHSFRRGSLNFFSEIGNKMMSSEPWKCITDFYLDVFTRPGQSEEIRGRRIVLYNSSNPDQSVSMEVTANQSFRGTEKGKDTYDLNTRRGDTGVDHARLYGNPLKDLCNPSDPDCKRTEISGYEQLDSGEKGEVETLEVECPIKEPCVAWGNWPIALYPIIPTPTPEFTPTVRPTSTRVPSMPTKLPVTGN